jgi:type IV pilus assembly protein PilV
MQALPRRKPLRVQAGVMMLEALVAILIFSLGVIALMGLQANSIAQVSAAKYRTDASYLASQILARMWMEPTTPAVVPLSNFQSNSYPSRAGWDNLVASTLPNGAGTIVVNGNIVTVTITWRQPADTVTHQFVTTETITRV